MKKCSLSPVRLQSILLLLATYGLLCYPQETSQAVTEGLSLCGKVIIPALFPFFILSSLILNLGLYQGIGKLMGGIMPKVFGLNPNCATALLLGFIGGYPVGAKTTLSLYQEKLCSKGEAEHLLGFANNAGPAFIIGVIGSGIFGSGEISLLLYASHILGCIATGVLLASVKQTVQSNTATGQHKSNPPFIPTFLQAVTTAMDNSFQICSFILCFSVIITLLELSGAFYVLAHVLEVFLPSEYTVPLMMGIIELSTGVTGLSHSSDPQIQLMLMAFLLGWAGLSIHCQVFALVLDSGLSLKPYLLGNLCQGVISAGVIWLFFYGSIWHILLLILLYGGGQMALRNFFSIEKKRLEKRLEKNL